MTSNYKYQKQIEYHILYAAFSDIFACFSSGIGTMTSFVDQHERNEH